MVKQLIYKFLKLTGASIFIGAAFIAPFALFTNIASAAAPKCYTVSGHGSVVKEADCNNEVYQRLAVLELGYGMRQDYCYVIATEAVGIAEAASGGGVCNDYANRASTYNNIEYRCYVYESDIEGRFNFWAGDYDPSALSKTECTDAMKVKVAGGQYSPGSCYIFWQGATNAPESIPCTTFDTVSVERRDEVLSGSINANRSAIIDCDGSTATGDPEGCLEENPIIEWILRGINFLSAGAGVIIAVSVVIAGIQYASAGPNPQQVASAKKRIISSIVALLALFFLYAFLQWVVPGGVF